MWRPLVSAPTTDTTTSAPGPAWVQVMVPLSAAANGVVASPPEPNGSGNRSMPSPISPHGKLHVISSVFGLMFETTSLKVKAPPASSLPPLPPGAV